MALYAIHCLDKPASLDLRMATREAHLAYMRGFAGRMKLAGPMLDEDGQMCGSILLLEAEAIEEAQAFSANDPYALAGLFQAVEIRQFKVTLGALA